MSVFILRSISTFGLLSFLSFPPFEYMYVNHQVNWFVWQFSVAENCHIKGLVTIPYGPICVFF